MWRLIGSFFVSIILFSQSGCTLGPATLRNSRNNFNEAVHVTARQELLLNLVRMRYHESEEFLRIPSITGQYVYDADLGGSGEWKQGVTTSKLSFGLGAQAKPTIVFAPEQGQAFNQRLLAPIGLETIDLLASKGWAIDRVLRLTVRSINDVDNATSAGGPTPSLKPEYEDFVQICSLLRRLQQAGHSVEIAYEDRSEAPEQFSDPIPVGQIDGEDLVLAAEKGYRFRIDGATATLWSQTRTEPALVVRVASDVHDTDEFRYVARRLELKPGLSSYRLINDAEGQLKKPNRSQFGAGGAEPREDLMISTRSLKEMMFYVSHAVDVPQEHQAAGFVTQTTDLSGQPFDWIDMTDDLFRVKASRKKPRQSAVSVRFRDYWFYVDDADIPSKSTFNLLLELLNLEIRAGGGSQIPLLTI